ncbi:MAG: hypothetical protein ACRD8W_12035 [Nitrososphaeraceae archaeon]
MFYYIYYLKPSQHFLCTFGLQFYSESQLYDKPDPLLGSAWFTINGQRYGEGNYYDVIDWVYDDDVEIRGINTNRLSKVLELSYLLEPGQDTTPIRDMFAALFLCPLEIQS